MQPPFTEAIASWQLFTFVVGVKEVHRKSYEGASQRFGGGRLIVSETKEEMAVQLKCVVLMGWCRVSHLQDPEILLNTTTHYYLH